MASPKIEALSKVGVDVEEGLQYCRNNEMIFLKIIQKYAEDAENKIKELQGYYDAKDFENYGIQVHGLKSSSKTMGVMDVSELAKEQEFAVKDGNLAKVDEEHETLFSLYREKTRNILAALSGELPAETAKAAGASMETGELKAKLNDLLELLHTFEATEAEKLAEEIAGKSFEDASIAGRLEEVKNCIGDFDLRSAAQKTEEIIAAL